MQVEEKLELLYKFFQRANSAIFIIKMILKEAYCGLKYQKRGMSFLFWHPSCVYKR